MRTRMTSLVALLAVVAAGISCEAAGPAASSPDMASAVGVPLLRLLQAQALTRANSASLGVVLVSEVAAMTTPGKLPGKTKFKLDPPQVGGAPGGKEGIIAAVGAGDLNLAPQKAYNKITVTAPGSKGNGNWENDLGLAIACAVINTNGSAKVNVKGKGAQSLPIGAVAGILVARLPLDAAGLSEADFLQLCKDAPDLIRDLLDDLL